MSPTGSDAALCIEAAPCKSFNRAYQIARPGDVVDVAAGSYPSQILYRKANAGPPHVVIRPELGARVVVGDDGATVGCMGFEGATYVTVVGMETAYTTVGGRRHQCGISVGRGRAHDVTLVDIDAGMIWFGADDVTVRGGDFGPSVDENMKIEYGTGHAPRNITIDGAVVHDARSYEQHQECLALWGGRAITIRNSTFSNCETFHIWLEAAGGVISDVLIEGNTFTQPDSSLGIASTIKLGDHGGELRDVVLRNNRILVDDLYVYQGYGERDSTGSITIEDNEVANPISLESGDDCMADATYTPKPGVVYTCRGNRLVAP
ncbi:MAG TPA: hypothetical protein VH650_08320 [Gaiellaceae bacterium]